MRKLLGVAWLGLFVGFGLGLRQPVSAADEAELTQRLVESGGKFKLSLSEANFTGVTVDDALAEAIGSQPSLVRLTITDSSMSLEGWQQLASLKMLEQLDLRGCAVSNEQLAAAVAGMPKLRALRLNGSSGATTVDDVGLKALKDCPDLKALALDYLWVGKAGLEYLSENKNLAELYLASTLVDDEATAALASMPSLRKLRLAQTTISKEGIEQLRALPLTDMDLSECSQLDDAAMVSLGQIKSLKRLNLWRDAITDEGVQALSGLSALEWLNLDNTQLTNEGLSALSSMKQLSFLHLGSTGVSDEGLSQLYGLKALKDLKVTRTAVTEAGVQAVQQALPQVAVQLKYVDPE